jgi:hypothetical protein
MFISLYLGLTQYAMIITMPQAKPKYGFLAADVIVPFLF